MAKEIQTFFMLVAFVMWTVTSFLCHKLAKTATEQYVTNMMPVPVLSARPTVPPNQPAFSGVASPVLAPLIITTCQLLACFLSIKRSPRNGRTFYVMAATHGAATLTTNISFAMMFASSTMAVKLLEPVTSAIIQRLVLDTEMSTESVLSIPVIVAGSVLFVGNPLASSAVMEGVSLAFFSNIMFGIRNVTIKLTQSKQTDAILISPRALTNAALVAMAVTGLSYYFEDSGLVPARTTFFIFLCTMSSVFHVLYSFISTHVVLRHMTVVSHAVANILKRLLVVLLLHVSGRRHASPWNWVGLVMCTCGLLLYNLRKIAPHCTVNFSSFSQNWSVTGICGQPARKTTFLAKLSLLAALLFGAFVLSIHSGGIVTFEKSRYSLQYGTGSANAPYDFSQTYNLLGNDTNVAGRTFVSKIFHVERRPLAAASNGTYVQNLFFGSIPWVDGRPLFNKNITFQPETKSGRDMAAFLETDPLQIPEETDGLSPYLKTSREVILEAQRLHSSVFSQIFGDRKFAILIGSASFENKGDSAMTIGEHRMLEKLGITVLFVVDVQSCGHDKMKRAKASLGPYTSRDVTIVMHGGGNLVGSYIAEHYCRERALAHFPGFRYVIMPQSFFMSGSQPALKSQVKAYCCNPNMTIILRDRLSLHVAKRLFKDGSRYFAPWINKTRNGVSGFGEPGTEVPRSVSENAESRNLTRLLLAPDIAFWNGPVSRFSLPLYDVIWLRRRDSETTGYKSIPGFPANVSVLAQDWMVLRSPRGNSSTETAYNVLMNGYLFLQRGRVVVTDRLHGHILSVLLDIPHVLLDNQYTKLSSYHNTWTRGITNTRIADNPQDAARLALELLHEYGDTLPKTFKAARIAE